MSDNANEEFAAHKLARAIADMRELELFDTPATHDESMSVTWVRGSALGGYKATSLAISKIVSERWAELRAEALARQAEKVGEARAELIAELAKAKP